MDPDSIISVLYGEDAQTRVKAELEQLYQGSIANLWEALHYIAKTTPTSSPPPLKVVHSFLARSQLLTVEDNRFIVHDQYLGEISNQLTRLMLCDAHPFLVRSYLAKVFAQRAMVAGRARDAAMLGILSRIYADIARQQSLTVIESSFCLGVRQQLVLVEEQFMLAHELAHIMLLDRPELVPVYADMARTAGMALDDSLDMTNETREELAKSMGRSLVWTIYPEVETPERTAQRDRIREDTSRAREDPRHLEEVSCDYLSGAAVLLTLASTLPTAIIASGATLGLANMRTVQWIDSLVKRIDLPEESPDAAYAAFELRYLSFKDLLCNKFLFNLESAPEHPTELAFAAVNMNYANQMMQMLHSRNYATVFSQLADVEYRRDKMTRTESDMVREYLDEKIIDLAELNRWLRMPTGTSWPEDKPLLYTQSRQSDGTPTSNPDGESADLPQS